MSFSDTYLYYLFINIPEKMMVNSLLFQERICRVIPSAMGMDEERYHDAQRPNAICRQYLGYDFIEDADFWQATKEVSGMFCNFLRDASTAKRTGKFELLLGKRYKQRFDFRKNEGLRFTQYFIYAQKFDDRVFDALMKLHWAHFHPEKYACELSNELCNLYMTLLACCISKQSGRPISTNVSMADHMIREPLFQEYFREALPGSFTDDALQELCISILMHSDADDSSGKQRPIDEVLTIHEAARIRAGLEVERRSFSECVSNLIHKTKVSNPTSMSEYLKINAREVIHAAEDYNRRMRVAATDAVDSERRKFMRNIGSGFSIAIPCVKLAIESSINGVMPGMGSLVGTGVEIAGLYLTTNVLTGQTHSPERLEPSKSENVHLFMNRLWDARDQRLPV